MTVTKYAITANTLTGCYWLSQGSHLHTGNRLDSNDDLFLVQFIF
jgi:hypothetical protein